MHEQKIQWAQSISVAMMASKKILFAMLVGCVERFEAHISELFADFDLFVSFTSCSDA